MSKKGKHIKKYHEQDLPPGAEIVMDEEFNYILDSEYSSSLTIFTDEYRALVESDTRVKIIKDMLGLKSSYISNDTLSVLAGRPVEGEKDAQ